MCPASPITASIGDCTASEEAAKNIAVIIVLPGTQRVSARLSGWFAYVAAIRSRQLLMRKAKPLDSSALGLRRARSSTRRDNLHERFEVTRINYQEAYGLDGACAHLAEDYLSRRRRAEIDTRRHVAGRLSPCARSGQRCRHIARSIKFWNVSNIDQPPRELEEHAGSVSRLVQGWKAMGDSEHTAAIPRIAVESDPCPKCQGPMMLARIMPGRLKFDLRTFECVSCDHVEKTLVAADPISSADALGWLLGELRSPT
jgi:hypothetical protein